MSHPEEHLHRESLVVAAGRPEPTAGGPLNTPLVPASSYHFGTERFYQRQGSPTSDSFEAALGTLEGGTAISYAAGVAAVAAVLDLLPLGAVAVVPRSQYWGVVELFHEAVDAGRLHLREVDITDTDATIAALAGAQLLWMEAASNPLIDVPDLPALCAAARAAGALSCVDATFATPMLVRPLEHGADLVMHSVSKYLSGHTDVVLGALVAADDAVADRLRAHRYRTGAIPGVLESYLALRGVRTLALRVERQQANALELATRLAEHPAVQRVRFPGLAEDPMHDRWAAIASGPGLMMSFELTDAAAADDFCDRVRLVTHATSLGGVESLVERRAYYEGERLMGTPESLIRFSVGIEHVEDLWADLQQALG